MGIPASLKPTTCDIYRPFGAASATTTGVACRLVSQLARGRLSGSASVQWTHYIDVDSDVDIRDGCSRPSGSCVVTYADGDEVRIPDGSGSRYVVVWVEIINRGTSYAYKRAYLHRHAAVWPGP